MSLAVGMQIVTKIRMVSYLLIFCTILIAHESHMEQSYDDTYRADQGQREGLTEYYGSLFFKRRERSLCGYRGIIGLYQLKKLICENFTFHQW